MTDFTNQGANTVTEFIATKAYLGGKKPKNTILVV